GWCAEVRVGPPDTVIQRLAAGIQALGDALADDHDPFAAGAILRREIAAGEDRHAERREETRRDVAQPPVRVLLAVGRRVAVAGELKAGAERAGVAPRHEVAGGDALDAGQLLD